MSYKCTQKRQKPYRSNSYVSTINKSMVITLAQRPFLATDFTLPNPKTRVSTHSISFLQSCSICANGESVRVSSKARWKRSKDCAQPHFVKSCSSLIYSHLGSQRQLLNCLRMGLTLMCLLSTWEFSSLVRCSEKWDVSESRSSRAAWRLESYPRVWRSCACVARTRPCRGGGTGKEVRRWSGNAGAALASFAQDQGTWLLLEIVKNHYPLGSQLWP